MRKNPTRKVERFRITEGALGSDKSYGANGAFFIPVHEYSPGQGASFKVVVSDGKGWEHVSVSLEYRCPTWLEMDWIKQIFWKDDETVMQLHVPMSEHINNVATCLHLWRPVNEEIPKPPAIFV